MFYRISFLCLLCTSLFSVEHVYLKTPKISHEEVIGTNVGIRPFRKAGIRIEAESIRNKLIIHNYGYGGSGLTLSFGGSQETLDLLDQQITSSKTVAVLGAGVIGLVTSYDLLEKGYTVHLYSDDWSPNLTSNVAGGIWTPLGYPSDLSNEKKSVHKRMLQIAEKRFMQCTSNDPEFEGVKMTWYYRIIPESVQKTTEGEEVVIHFDNGLVRKGVRNYRLVVDGKIFIEDLMAKIESKGAHLHQKHFENLEDVLNLDELIVINCMSMGSREIFDDQEFTPIRGHLVYFKSDDQIDYFVSQGVPDSDYYVTIHPWKDRIILGGVYEYGKEVREIDQEVIDTLIRNGQKCLSGEL